MRRDREVVIFDESARRDFLKGFRKRKLQRKEAAATAAKEKEKAMRREARATAKRARMEAVGLMSGPDLTGADVTVFPIHAAGARDGEEDGEAAGGERSQTRTLSDDAFSKAAFGAASVVVATKAGLPAVDGPHAHTLALAAMSYGKDHKTARDGGERSGSVVGKKRRRDEATLRTSATAKPKPWSKAAAPPSSEPSVAGPSGLSPAPAAQRRKA